MQFSKSPSTLVCLFKTILLRRDNVISLLLAILPASGAYAQTVWFVNNDAVGQDTGANWLNAFADLQDALAVAKAGDSIWVAAGVYKPDRRTGDREMSFVLTNGVALFGGFAGDETTFEERAGLVQQTILTGDLAGNDGPDFEGTEENSFRVTVTEMSAAADTVWNGFTITGGNDDRPESEFPLGSGGGMYNEGASPTVRSCYFRNNQAGFGGGVMNHLGSSPVFEGCTFEDNAAVRGGGMYSFDGSDISLHYCTFLRNTGEAGSALYTWKESRATLDDCLFSENVTISDGAIFHLMSGGNGKQQPLVLHRCSFFGNAATATEELGVSAVYLAQTDSAEESVMTDCVFRGNRGGVAMSSSGNSLRMERCDFLENTGALPPADPPVVGAVLKMSLGQSESRYTVRGCRFIDNDGIGMLLDARGAGAVIDDTVFQGNQGGAEISGSSLARVTNCRFIENSGRPALGTGPYGSLMVSGCVFERNSGGPAMDCRFRVDVVLSDSLFTGNSAERGGALRFTPSEAGTYIANCVFIGNTATVSGGAVVVAGFGAHAGDLASLVNCVFDANQAPLGGAILFALYQSGATVSLVNCTLTQNHADDEGGAIYFQGTSCSAGVLATVGNSILWDNSPEQLSGVFLCTLRLSSNCIQDGWDGNGENNFDLEPLFVDADGVDGIVGTEDDDLRLSLFSPCIDQGDDALLPDDGADVDGDGNLAEPTPLDLDGNPRIADGDRKPPAVVDMGAYEFQPLAIVHGGAGVSFAAHAFSGYVDPRAESSNGVNLDLGLDRVRLVFNHRVIGADSAEVETDDFVVTQTGDETPPQVVAVNLVDNVTYDLVFDRVLTVREWTTIRALVRNTYGDSIINLGDLGPGVREPDRIDVGFLPGDVDQNRVVGPLDLLRFRQFVTGVSLPTSGDLSTFVDTDRNGEVGPLDLLRYRQLINGVQPATRSWAGADMNNPQP